MVHLLYEKRRSERMSPIEQQIEGIVDERLWQLPAEEGLPVKSVF